MASDPATCHTFPIEGHVCLFLKHPARVGLAHQTQYCLGDPTRCLIYRGEVKAAAVIGEAQAGRGLTLGHAALAAVGLVIVLLVFTSSGLGSRRSFSAAATPTAMAQSTSALSVAAAPSTPTPAPSATPTRTAAPTGTWTPVPTAGPDVATPVGPFGVMLYIVQPGESFASIAATYHSSVAVLVAANGLPDAERLLAGQFLIVPVGIVDTTGVPRFVTYRVASRSESLTDIAAKFGANSDEVRMVNDLGSSPLVPQGRLLFIPQKPIPTSTPAGQQNPFNLFGNSPGD